MSTAQLTGVPPKVKIVKGGQTQSPPDSAKVNSAKGLRRTTPARMSVTVSEAQNNALERLAESTGLQKSDLIREAIGLLTVARTAWSRDLELAIVDQEDRVLKHIISTGG
jgi:16S rRNA U516 pseudouridylate synthase RsuA-like enzyme